MDTKSNGCYCRTAGRSVPCGPAWPEVRTRSSIAVMRFTYAEAMTRATFYAPLARAAEAAGYTSMTVADSLIYPEVSDSKYPYTDTGDREFLDGKEFIETMVLCAHLFAVT